MIGFDFPYQSELDALNNREQMEAAWIATQRNGRGSRSVLWPLGNSAP